jgi:hypothetical protein
MNKRRKVSISDGVTKVNSDESPGSLKQNMPIKNEPSPSASPVVETSPSPEPSSAPSPEPSMESAASPSPRASLPLTSDYQTLHPHEGAILFKMVGKETVVSFAWGKSETGTLEVRGPLGAVVGHAEVKNESHAKVLLAVESEYSWSVHDASGKAVVGPYRFKIYSGTKHKLVDLINGSEKAEIEMTK